jgi:hypothetical protein
VGDALLLEGANMDRAQPYSLVWKSLAQSFEKSGDGGALESFFLEQDVVPMRWPLWLCFVTDGGVFLVV